MNASLQLESCTKTGCKPCDIVYIIKDYIKPLMQLLTNDIRDYYMRLLTTKCLNSSVSISYFLLGYKKGIAMSNYCDTHLTRKRHNDGIDNNLQIVQQLKKDVLNRNFKYRYLYYILMTDASFPMKDQPDRFFPGHVFLLEKIPGKPTPSFYFYQSYINEYDINGHYHKNNKTLKMPYNRTAELMDRLAYIITNPVWDERCVRFWKDFTHVDTSKTLQGSSSGNQFFICYRKTKATACLEHVKRYVDDKLKTVDTSKPQDIYGDMKLYDADQNPLSNLEMYNQLASLQKRISNQ